MTTTPQPETIDDYIAGFPEDVKQKLQQVREAIKIAAPNAEEAISYAMPTFKLHGNLIHFAGYRNHIGLYPAPQAIEEFKAELSNYPGAKGSIQFPLSEPMPLDLITRITKYRVQMQMAKALRK
jgi:uncharacterized protein YdhG (YjbR/CyaY superfamily)